MEKRKLNLKIFHNFTNGIDIVNKNLRFIHFCFVNYMNFSIPKGHSGRYNKAMKNKRAQRPGEGMELSELAKQQRSPMRRMLHRIRNIPKGHSGRYNKAMKNKRAQRPGEGMELSELAKQQRSPMRRMLHRIRNDWLLYVLLLPVLIWYVVFCYLPMGGITLAFRNYRYDMGMWHSPWVGLQHFKTMFADSELIWYVVFCYLPMGGITLAFRNYRYDMGMWHSPWVGLQHFKTMFADSEFWRAFKNTLVFSIGRLIFHFPIPIIVAILLNEIRHPGVKKFFQTVFTFPHFISWVVLSGILINMFASNGIINQILGALGFEQVAPLMSQSSVFTFPHFISWVVLSGILINMFASNGIINQILGALGFEQVAPLMSQSSFRPFIWISNIWKEFGWDSIIYMAALTSIDQQLYEAASIDGANRFQKMLHVTWPGIRGTVCIMLILQIGSIMGGASFDQIFNLYSSPVANRFQKMLHVTWPGIRGTVCIMLILQIGSIMGGASFDQIFNLYSSPVYPVADIIDTYVYRQSFSVGTNFGYTTAIGLLKSVIGVVMVWSANKVTTKMGEDGLF